MRTEEEAWLREQLRIDTPPPMTPLDGREVLHQGRSRRRRRQIATRTPLAVAGALVLGTSLWATQLLPDSVQEALPAAPGSAALCPDIASGQGSLADGSAGTPVTSAVEHLAVLDWGAPDGTQVLVIRTTDGCLVPDGQENGEGSGVGLSVLTQAPGGPLMLHGSRDAGEDVARWGASVLEVPGQDVAVGIVPPAAEQVTLPQGEPVQELTPILDDQGQVVAQVASLAYAQDPQAVLWQVADTWSLSWLSADVVAQPLPGRWRSEAQPSPVTDPPDWEVWPQIARTDGGLWWAWVGGGEVFGPVEAPEGPWAMHLTDDELGDAFLGWAPTGTTHLLVDGESWDVLDMEQTLGEPVTGLTPFVRDVYQPAQEVVAIDQNGEPTTIRVVDVPRSD